MKIAFSPNGDLRFRLEKSFERLQEKEYQLHIEHQRDEGGWPGDWEGRTLLALIELAKTLCEKPSNFDLILDTLFSNVGGKRIFRSRNYRRGM